MIQIEDIQRVKQEHERQFEPTVERMQGTLLAKDYATSATVRNRPGYVWYRQAGQSGNGAQAISRKISPIPGLPVILQRVRPNESWEVVDVDTQTISRLDNYTATSFERHASEHEPGGSDPLYVYLRMITPLRTTPQSGLAVNVAPLVYDNAGTLTTFSGYNNYSLSASVPGSGLARYTLVYLNPSTNALAVVDGSTGPNGGAVALSFPAVPAGSVPSAYVRLEYGQTTITESNIVDARLLLNGMRTGTGEYLTADGSIDSTGQQDFTAGIKTDDIDSVSAAGIAVADDILSAVSIQGIHDAPLVDSANASGVTSHFRDNDSSYPAGWTVTDAAASTNTNTVYSYWQLLGTSSDTTWKYRVQTNVTVESYTANRPVGFLFGPIVMRDGNYGADLHYRFGMYRDNSGIDENTYVRLDVYWNSASSVWQIRVEESDGSTSHTSSYVTMNQDPLQPFYVRMNVYNNAAKQVRGYYGSNALPLGDYLMLTQTPTSAPTWGQVWLQVQMSRGAGVTDALYIGSVDYLANLD